MTNMASLIPGYEYDIFISYRQKDNKHDGWVSEFVTNLKGELESTFKEEISVYYESASGTSFASPIVAGLVAMIWSYYPTFTYKQIRYCFEQSATPINTMVIKPGTNNKVPFSSLCKSGRIVNAYQALIIAEQINKPSWKRKHKSEILE
jgi:subtilisin family serine protease